MTSEVAAGAAVFPFEHPVEVRFRDCDVLRHVNNAVYFTYFEEARLAWWRQLTGAKGIGDIRFVVAHAECDFRAPATVGDPLRVRTRVARLGGSSFTLQYEVVDARDRRVYATGRTVLVVFDPATGRPAAMAPEFRALLDGTRSADRPSAGGPR